MGFLKPCQYNCYTIVDIWLIVFTLNFEVIVLQVALSRAFNGIGLALVTPAIQSLVADSTDDSNRGMVFGWLQLTGNVGSIIGGLFSVLTEKQKQSNSIDDEAHEYLVHM